MAGVRAGDLTQISNPAVDPLTVWVRPAPWWLRVVWREPFVGLAVPWGIYLRAGPETFEPSALRGILAHELVHIAQWRELGARRFLQSYLGDYFAGRFAGLGHLAAYRKIKLERDPRIDDR